MARKGRKPLATGHVERLSGSELAKLRLRTILQAIRGEITVAEACQRLAICESRFHVMRNQWLQEALELLEPRPLGRPAKQSGPMDLQQRLVALETENEDLRQRLEAAEVRRELAQVLPHVVSADAETPQKKTVPRPQRRQKRPR
jgi:hypothetical protein